MLKKSSLVLERFLALFVAISTTLAIHPSGFCQTPDGEKITKVASWDWPSSSTFDGFISSYLDQRQASAEDRAKVAQSWKLAEGLKVNIGDHPF